MHFVLICVDKPGHGDVRAANRDDHVAYLKAHADQIVTVVLTRDCVGVSCPGADASGSQVCTALSATSRIAR